MAATGRALATALGKSHTAVEKWLRHPAWPFGRRGPWSIDAVRAWAAAALQPNRADYGSLDTTAAGRGLSACGHAQAGGSPFGAQQLADLPLPVRIELNLKIKRGQLLELERLRLEGKLHDVQACRHRRLRQIHIVKGRLLDLARSVAPLLEGKDRAAIQTILDERLRAMLEAFSGGEGQEAATGATGGQGKATGATDGQGKATGATNGQGAKKDAPGDQAAATEAAGGQGAAIGAAGGQGAATGAAGGQGAATAPAGGRRPKSGSARRAPGNVT